MKSKNYFNFTSEKKTIYYELKVSTRLKDGIKYKSELFVYVDENDFKKIDEDLYYRNKEDDSDKFIPSDNEIIINFEMVKIIVKKYGSNKD
jgi:hypothetical protein